MKNRDSNNCTGSNENISSAKKVCKRRSRNFQGACFDEFPLWREWVVRIEYISKCYCKIFDKTMERGRSQIVNHESTAVYRKKVKLSDKLTSYGIACNSNSSNLASHSSRIAFLTANEENADLDAEDVGVDTKPAAFQKKVQ